MKLKLLPPSEGEVEVKDLTPEQMKEYKEIDWWGSVPIISTHIGAAIACFLVSWSWTNIVFFALAYYIRMFFVTGFYHRYFSHKTFSTSRFFQFGMAFASQSSGQQGVLWWAAHHRRHHSGSDIQYRDLHSPTLWGEFQSQIGWLFLKKSKKIHYDSVPDLLKYPELEWLGRWGGMMPFFVCMFGSYLLGEILGWCGLSTNGIQLVLCWVICTIVLLHATSLVNSLLHILGTRKYPTTDTSRNLWILVLFVLGEQSHNNHHYKPMNARSGEHWFKEPDPTYWGLIILESFGLIWDLYETPEKTPKA